MRTMPADSVDAVVCDPPYGLRFMGKDFDTLGDGPAQQEWHRVWLIEAFRVLKPGGYLMAFGGTRTFHRLTLAVGDAGFALDGAWVWAYGSGFPKSHNLAKAIDKINGTVKVVGEGRAGKTALGQSSDWNHTNEPHRFDIIEPNSDAAKRWNGWGTALKPAWEPIVVAHKPGDVAPLTGPPFLYCAKANKKERNGGLDELDIKRPDERSSSGMGTFEEKGVQPQRNHHPTVKPVGVMRWLIEASTKPEELVLDPFVGSGTTGCAAIAARRNFRGIEMNAEYTQIADLRCRYWERQPSEQPQESLF